MKDAIPRQALLMIQALRGESGMVICDVGHSEYVLICHQDLMDSRELRTEEKESMEQGIEPVTTPISIKERKKSLRDASVWESSSQ